MRFFTFLVLLFLTRMCCGCIITKDVSDSEERKAMDFGFLYDNDVRKSEETLKKIADFNNDFGTILQSKNYESFYGEIEGLTNELEHKRDSVTIGILEKIGDEINKLRFNSTKIKNKSYRKKCLTEIKRLQKLYFESIAKVDSIDEIDQLDCGFIAGGGYPTFQEENCTLKDFLQKNKIKGKFRKRIFDLCVKHTIFTIKREKWTDRQCLHLKCFFEKLFKKRNNKVTPVKFGENK